MKLTPPNTNILHALEVANWKIVNISSAYGMNDNYQIEVNDMEGTNRSIRFFEYNCADGSDFYCTYETLIKLRDAVLRETNFVCSEIHKKDNHIIVVYGENEPGITLIRVEANNTFDAIRKMLEEV